jgi:hypothetical protein
VVSTAGGERPMWTSAGTALLYSTGRTVMRATIDADSLTVGSPTKVIDLGDQRLVGVAPDGRLLVSGDARPPSRSAVLAINWEREARRLLGPPAAALPR